VLWPAGRGGRPARGAATTVSQAPMVVGGYAMMSTSLS
jgi:hypothetical protein